LKYLDSYDCFYFSNRESRIFFGAIFMEIMGT
jgi:hypothetical protein